MFNNVDSNVGSNFGTNIDVRQQPHIVINVGTNVGHTRIFEHCEKKRANKFVKYSLQGVANC